MANVFFKHSNTSWLSLFLGQSSLSLLPERGVAPFYSLKPDLCVLPALLDVAKHTVFPLTSLKLMSFQAKSMKRCPSLLNNTRQIVEDMNLLYIRQISKKLQVHTLASSTENDDVCVPETTVCESAFQATFQTMISSQNEMWYFD